MVGSNDHNFEMECLFHVLYDEDYDSESESRLMSCRVKESFYETGKSTCYLCNRKFSQSEKLKRTRQMTLEFKILYKKVKVTKKRHNRKNMVS